MKVISVASLLFLIGLTIHYLFKDTQVQSVWDKYYFLWDKMKDLLLFFGYLFFISTDRKELRATIKAICFFCVIRIIWEFLAIGKDYVFASNIRIIDVIFALLILSISWIWIKSNIYSNGKKRSTTLGFKRNSGV